MTSIGGDVGVAAVRRAEPAPGGGWVYAVEFVDLGSRLENRISDLLMGERAGILERWERYNGPS